MNSSKMALAIRGVIFLNCHDVSLGRKHGSEFPWKVAFVDASRKKGFPSSPDHSET